MIDLVEIASKILYIIALLAAVPIVILIWVASVKLAFEQIKEMFKKEQ